MQKALTEMNVQLHRVISDITGTTGLAILHAIVAGKRDQKKLAALKDGRIKASGEEIAAALTGDYRPELVFILQQELQLYEFYQAQIAACDLRVEQCLAQFSDKVDVTTKPLSKPKRRGKKQPGNAPQFDLRTHLYRISGVDFTQIDGFGALTVLTLLSEVGLDPSRFPTVKHFTSWLGLCPGSRITGGKVTHFQNTPSGESRSKRFSYGSANSLPISLRFGSILSSYAGTDGSTQSNYRSCTQTGTHFLPPLDI
jgi:hypothetical protein